MDKNELDKSRAEFDALIESCESIAWWLDEATKPKSAAKIRKLIALARAGSEAPTDQDQHPGLMAEIECLNHRIAVMRNELAMRHAKDTGDVWYWQGDGSDDPASMVNTLTVAINAADLRAILAAPTGQQAETECPCPNVEIEYDDNTGGAFCKGDCPKTAAPVSAAPTAEQIAKVILHLIGEGAMDWKAGPSGDPEEDAFSSDADELRVLVGLVNKALAAPTAAAGPSDKHLPGWERGIATVTLNGNQLLEALEALDYIAPDRDTDPDQLDNDLTFGIVRHKGDEGKEAAGMCCWNDDTDGVLPLDGDYVPTKEGDGEVDAKYVARLEKDANRYIEIQAAFLSHDSERIEAMLTALTSSEWWEHFDRDVDAAIAAQPKDTTDTTKEKANG